MKSNFLKRIITSIFLLLIIFACLSLSKFLWIYLIIITSIISFYEFSNLIKKIYKTNKNKIYFFNIGTFIYLVMFIFSGYYYYGTVSLLFLILICILSDTGGYFIGKLIGGKKLTKISPNKTISGSIGSFIFSLISIIIFAFILKDILKNNFVSFIIYENIFLIIFICLYLS